MTKLTGTLAGLSALLLSSAALADFRVFEAGKLFDGQSVIEDARLVVEDGRVVAVGPRDAIEVPEGAEIRDHSAHFIMPGLIAAHSHAGTVEGTEHGGEFYARETVDRDLRQFALYGITAVNALGMNRPLFYELREELRGPGYEGADLYGAGTGIGTVEGAPPEGAMGVKDDQIERPATPEAAREAVRRIAAQGVDMIKVWVDPLGGDAPSMAPEIYRAAIEEAHAQGLKAAAHIHNLADAKGVLEAEVDVVAHGVRDEPVDDEFITLMRTSGAWYVPTIQINEAEYIYAENPEWLEDAFFVQGLSSELRAQIEDESWREEALADAEGPRESVRTNIENLRLLHEAGIANIAFGTDSGATALRIPGFAEHRELELMVQAGMEEIDVLRAATARSADMMAIEDLGRLVPGARAAFLVLEGDPTADIIHTRRIVEFVRD